LTKLTTAQLNSIRRRSGLVGVENPAILATGRSDVHLVSRNAPIIENRCPLQNGRRRKRRSETEEKQEEAKRDVSVLQAKSARNVEPGVGRRFRRQNDHAKHLDCARPFCELCY
jgi:hypothetical protein